MKFFTKQLMLFALSLATGWTVASALPTKMLTADEASAITYSWTDASGGSHSSTLAETAKDPYQIYEMIREVYTNPAVPGIWQATYEGPSYSSSAYTSFDAGLSERPGTAYYLTNPDNATRGRDVYYGAIGEGWDISGSSDTQYKPTVEGYTMLFVALNDGYQDYCTPERLAANPYFSTKAEVIELIENTIDSVFVVTEGIRVNEGTTNAGAVFSVKGYFNRFFFMTKGRANDITYGQGQYKTWRDKTSYTTSSGYPNADEHMGTMPLFNMMFEQYSPNDATIETESGYTDLTDFYSSMVAGSTYDVKHDCNSVAYQHHGFSMAGSGANTHYTIAGLNIFIPDRRLETWYQESLDQSGKSWVWDNAYSPSSYTTKVLDGRTRWDGALWAAALGSGSTTSAPYWTYDSDLGMYYTYNNEVPYSNGTATIGYPLQNTTSTKYYFYNPKHYPKMNLYTVKLTAEAVPSSNTGYYTVNLDWTSSFNVLVSDVPQKYWVYIIKADGSYEFLTSTTDVTHYDYEVPLGDPFSYTINYIVMAQPIDSNGNVFFTETWSNEDDVEIPGTTTNERFRLLLVDNISRYTTVGEVNNYDNRLRLQNIGITSNALKDGDNTFTFHRKAPDGTDHEFATLNLYKGGPAIYVSSNDLNVTSSGGTFKVNTSGVTGTVTLTASSGFSVSPSSFTADGSNHTITVTRTSGTSGTVTITAAGANTQVVNLSYSPFSSTTINYGSMSGTSLSSSTDSYGGTWSYNGTGQYAYGLSGTISNVNYMYFTNDGYARYTFAGGTTINKADVTIVTASGNYGIGTLIVNGKSITYNGSNTSNTFTDVDASSGVITITCPGGSNGDSGYSLRIRSITITKPTTTTENPTTGAVAIKPTITYTDANAANNTTLNFTARPFAANDTIDLYGVIDYVNDVFSQYVGDNNHPAYYDYYVTFEGSDTGGGDEPGGDESGTVIGSLDLSSFSTGSGLTPSSPWGGSFIKQSSFVYIASGSSITFTVPEGYSNATFTVGITWADTSDGGNGCISINGNVFNPTRATTCYYTINNISSGDVITIKGCTSTGGNRYSPDIDPSSTIYIYSGTVTGN